MLLYDLGSYGLHNLQHHIPLRWRFHRVHHSDLSLNATSALRFHPLDVVLSQGLFPCVSIPLIGMSMASFILYGTLAILLLIPQHSNLKFPGWFGPTAASCSRRRLAQDSPCRRSGADELTLRRRLHVLGSHVRHMAPRGAHRDPHGLKEFLADRGPASAEVAVHDVKKERRQTPEL
jgi:predicted membrane metal-binding protein